ncbi:toprim domain-containing protein [uncultured Parabacteroides sp.]|uniref:toprim domain-containing protein n=1 Tax=uncultured Parabacteroides sp. TaxID=512312 RepID=UPI00259813E2|nr:toprim domain-containing protein [uncultured Parabacteroides sp.]
MPYACGDSDLTPAYLDFEVGVSPGMVPKEWYKMRNHVIFPLRDEMGGLIGFAARKQPDGDPDEPKYRNTSVEEGYRKSENLYALNLAKEAIRQDGFAFVVEGYKDAIAMHAAGFRNTVALCGTAMCDGHVALLKKYTSQVTVLLDGDRAGEKGSTEAVAILRREGLWAVKGRLPAGEDPDSLFRLWGKEAFVSFIRGLRKQLLSSEEVALFNRISRQVQLLLQKHNAGERKVLLSDLTKMFAYRTGLSLRDGHPATLDWRWL